MVALGAYNYGITLSCLIGLGLSIYAYMVELQVEENHDYQAVCDLSEHMSCTKVFSSPYGRGIGGILTKYFGEKSVLNAPNSLYGIITYSLLATIAQSSSKFITKVSYVIILICNLCSLYFAYILYFILYNLCVVCVATYVVNFVNMSLTLMKLKKINELSKAIDTKKKHK